jgi:hypothetical protein
MTRSQFRELQKKFYDDAHDLSQKKNSDYATGGNEDADAFANFKTCETYDKLRVSAEVGAFIRLLDKISRLSTLIQPGYEAQVKDESIRDTCLDISNYSSLIYGLMLEKTSKKEGDAIVLESTFQQKKFLQEEEGQVSKKYYQK